MRRNLGGLVLVLLVGATLAAGCGGDASLFADVGRDAYGHLEILASRPHRRAGSPEFEEASRYVARALRAVGLDVSFQEFPFPYYELGPFSVAADGKARKAFPVFYSAPTSEQGVTAVCAPRDAEDVAGKILVTDVAHLEEDRERAESEGATGIVVSTHREPYYTQDLPFAVRFRNTGWDTAALPAMVVAGAEDLPGRTATLLNLASPRRGIGRNIVGVRRGSTGRYILVTAHLDSWFQGAVDDGTGVAVLLEIARLLEGWSSPIGLVFLAADCEEIGLVGSSVFARRFDDGAIVCVLELDMVSAVNGYSAAAAAARQSIPPFLVQTANLAPWVAAFDESLPGVAIPFPALVAHWIFGIRTDYEWFWGQGVPGLFVNTLFREYHTEADTVDLVEPANLESVALAARTFLESVAAGADTLGESAHIPVRLGLAKDGGTIRARLEVEGGGFLAAPRKVSVTFYRDNGYEARVVPDRVAPGVYETVHAPSGPGTVSARADVEGLLAGIAQAEIEFP